jgi:hypothetical protein
MKILFQYQTKKKKELEAVEYITKLFQEAATISTAAIKHQVPEPHNILVYEKRRARHNK